MSIVGKTRPLVHARASSETDAVNGASAAKKSKTVPVATAAVVASGGGGGGGGGGAGAGAAPAPNSAATDVKMSYSPAPLKPKYAAPTLAQASASASASASATTDNDVAGLAACIRAWYALIKKQPNYFSKAKFDMKDPTNPKTNTFCLVPGAFANMNRGGTKGVQQTTVRVSPNPDFMADWGGRRGREEAAKQKAAKAKGGSGGGGGGGGTIPVKADNNKSPISAEILTPPMVPLYMTVEPYGSLAETNPGQESTNSFPYHSLSAEKKKLEKVDRRMTFDGWAPVEDMKDPADPTQRDKEYVRFKNFMNDFKCWQVAYIFASPKEIRSKFRDALLDKYTDPGTVNAHQMRINDFLGSATSDIMPNIKVKDEERDAFEAKGMKLKGEYALNTERFHVHKNLLWDDSKNKDGSLKTDHQLSLQAIELRDPIARALMERGFKVMDMPCIKARGTLKKGEPVIEYTPIPSDKRPFRTCGYTETGTAIPLSAEQKRSHMHYLVAVHFTLDSNLDGGAQGTASIAYRRNALNLVIFESSIPRQRPRPEAAPAMQPVDASQDKEAADAIRLLATSAAVSDALGLDSSTSESASASADAWGDSTSDSTAE
jgi:hypothetical protein